MQYKAIHSILPVLGLLLLSGSGWAQSSAPSNKPTTATQVPTISSGSVATTPSGYIISGQSPLGNFVRERDAMGRITDTIQYAAAGYVDVKETTNYFDGLGRPLQTVSRQITPG